MNGNNIKNTIYIRLQPSRLKFPKNLIFRPSGDGSLVCNGKKVKVVASQVIHPIDFPPIGLDVDAVGIFIFEPLDVDCYIFSFANKTNYKTECAVVPAGLFSNHKPLQKDGKTIKLKLFLSSRGLREFRDSDGGEFYFMGIFLDENRNYTKYYNNWSYFE